METSKAPKRQMDNRLIPLKREEEGPIRLLYCNGRTSHYKKKVNLTKVKKPL
jgi:hypothetical protein